MVGNDIGILKRRHPQNLQLLEKKYSAELNDLSNDLQSKIEEYSSVKKEKDHDHAVHGKIRAQRVVVFAIGQQQQCLSGHVFDLVDLIA